MGVTDLLKPVLERSFGGEVHFGRVRVKPGKPTTFASVPLAASEGTEADDHVEGGGTKGRRVPVFALPGNPASALCMFYVFVVPALRRLGGWAPSRCHLPRVRVQVSLSSFLKSMFE
jgi:gephyrin